MTERTYVEVARREFGRTRRIAELALSQLDDAAFFCAPAEGDNSVAVMVKHLAGNMRSRWRDFLTTDGEKPDRDRDTEFVIVDHDTRASLMAHWTRGWDLLEETIDALADRDLGRVVTIRGEDHTVLQAINRQLTHYAYHAGQIVFLARHLVGSDWRTLSVPRGGSVAFNRSPAPYLSPAEPHPEE